MATYDHLPVYKESYDLLVELFQCAKHFNREYKYTLGEKIRDEVIALILHIYRANSVIDGRAGRLVLARESVELVRLYLRILRDLRQIDLDRFISLNLKIESVSKQLLAWQRKC